MVCDQIMWNLVRVIAVERVYMIIWLDVTRRSLPRRANNKLFEWRVGVHPYKT